ncbi:anti-sigma factor family protein [Terriglobus roseus]|uniref:Putative zinc-finger n=1 Tax=Terriglobus roseus TaxID=392734 RepID=A0A1H4J3Y9_9BACT|nr:zf-HC2 domain-containing protein [Terriglobus roseus]SEB41059.1 Putative zinc-finger [Terriglobus roseus]
MTCTEFLAQMTDYFDGDFEPQLLEEIQSHLCECHHCEILVDTTRKTIRVYRDHQVYDLTDEVRERTVARIMAACTGPRA